MTTILDLWCALCDHLAPFAAMAVPVLLVWMWSVETTPAELHESVSTAAGDETGSRNTDLLRDATEKGVTTADTPGRWAA